MKKVRATLLSSISECEVHCQKIERSKALLRSVFPVTVDAFISWDESIVEHVDQWIYRFTKMQDAMGKRFFPALFLYLENDSTIRPFLDILNRLEKLEVLSSVADWQFFRNLRNNLAHDYPESLQQNVETLNLLMDRIDVFLNMFQKARNYFKDFEQNRT